MACGPIPSSPLPSPAAGALELPPEGAPLDEVPLEPPAEDPPGAGDAVPSLLSEQPLPVWAPPLSEPEHAAVATPNASTASESENVSESFMAMDPFEVQWRTAMGQCVLPSHRRPVGF